MHAPVDLLVHLRCHVVLHAQGLARTLELLRLDRLPLGGGGGESLIVERAGDGGAAGLDFRQGDVEDLADAAHLERVRLFCVANLFFLFFLGGWR